MLSIDTKATIIGNQYICTLQLDFNILKNTNLKISISFYTNKLKNKIFKYSQITISNPLNFN